MGKKVTLTTQGYDIEPVFGFIAFVVMPEVCLITTVLASACFGTSQTTGLDCMAYGQSGVNSVGMLNSTPTPIAFALVALHHIAFEGFELYATTPLRRMLNSITRTAKRNDIELMFWLVALTMMVHGGLLAAVLASACLCALHTATGNCVRYSYSGFASFGILGLTAKHTIVLCSFIFGCLAVCRKSGLEFRSITIASATLANALSTKIAKAVFATLVSAKIIESFDFLAVAALLCYHGLRHGFFLPKKLCLELPAGYNPPAARFIWGHPTRFQQKNQYI